MKRLPEYKKCQENVELGHATGLEEFIYEWEPANMEEAQVWRNMLQSAVNSVKDDGIFGTPICDEGQILLTLEQEPE